MNKTKQRTVVPWRLYTNNNHFRYGVQEFKKAMSKTYSRQQMT